MAKLFEVLQGQPKAAFSEKEQMGDQGKFLKNHPQSSPRLKGQRLEKILGEKKHVQKCPNGQVMAIFARSFKTRIF